MIRTLDSLKSALTPNSTVPRDATGDRYVQALMQVSLQSCDALASLLGTKRAYTAEHCQGGETESLSFDPRLLVFEFSLGKIHNNISWPQLKNAYVGI